MRRPVRCRWLRRLLTALVSASSDIRRAAQRAMQYAISKRWVSVIALPGNVAANSMPTDAVPHALVTSRLVVRPSDADIAQVADLFNGARILPLFCGSGCTRAHDEVDTIESNLRNI